MKQWLTYWILGSAVLYMPLVWNLLLPRFYLKFLLLGWSPRCGV